MSEKTRPEEMAETALDTETKSAEDQLASKVAKLTELKEQEEQDLVQLVQSIKGKLETKIENLSSQVVRVAESLKKQEQISQSLFQTLSTVQQQVSNLDFTFDNFKQVAISTADFCSALEKMIKEETNFTYDNLIYGIDGIIATRNKADVDRAVKKGTITAVEKISKQSFIVSKEFDEEGKLISSRSQGFIAAFPVEYAEKMIGQEAGFVLELKNGNTLEVTEIFDPVVAPEVPKEAPPAPKLSAEAVPEAEERSDSNK